MKFRYLALGAVVTLAISAAAPADEFTLLEEELAGDAASIDAAPAGAPVAGRHQIVLGPIGTDSEGREGRLHTVVRRDTLWDISAAYLGTPWVWPSVWIENEGIRNPHLIYPGDLIWITSNEMRRVTREQADALLAGPKSDAPMEPEVPAALEQVVLSVPLGDGLPGPSVHVDSREEMSFVTSDELDAASSLVDSPSPRYWIAEGDVVYLGLGEGEVEPGARFTVFRDAEPVRDLGGNLLGYHIRVLGWVEVDQVNGDTSVGHIRRSVAEMERGDRVLPKDDLPTDLALADAPADLSGHIVHFPDSRTVAGGSDYVFLDRGSLHGLEIGDALEVYDSGQVKVDRVRSARVRTPDHAVANLVVVSVQHDSSVAFVAHASRELERGDSIRAAIGEYATR